MPRNDRYDDDVMSRQRSHREDESGYRRNEGEQGGFFGSGRESERSSGSERQQGDWGGFGGDDREPRRRSERGEQREGSRGRGEDRQFGSDDFNRGIAMDETRQLIASNKVEGTPVYDRHGDKLGTIHNFMVDKRKGHVVYAVLKHGGGFLGMNERYYPLEWDQLTYDTRLDGYHVEISEEDLEGFGSFDSEGRWQRRRAQESGRSDRGRDRW